MTVVAVAFVPAAPLLVPVVAAGSAGLDAEMRDASVSAVTAAVRNADRVVIVAPADVSGEWDASAVWDFSGFGVPRPTVGDRVRLPWTLGIGAWLLDECGWNGSRRYVALTAGDAGPAASDLGDETVALVVVGDGSACRTEKAPGYLDDRAEAFDAAIERVLRDGDVQGLRATDPLLAGELLCRTVPAWKWASDAMAGRAVAEATVTYAAAPYGVAYFVAGWRL